MTTGGRANPIVAPPWVFYSSPFCAKGLWIRAHLCTAQVDCPHEGCESKQWEPCRHVGTHPCAQGRYVGWAHKGRRDAAKKLPPCGLDITVRVVGDSPGPPGNGYKVALALPPGGKV